MLGNINLPTPPGFPYFGSTARVRQPLRLAPTQETSGDPSDLRHDQVAGPKTHEAGC